jgi:hypothetical protein
MAGVIGLIGVGRRAATAFANNEVIDNSVNNSCDNNVEQDPPPDRMFAVTFGRFIWLLRILIH